PARKVSSVSARFSTSPCASGVSAEIAAPLTRVPLPLPRSSTYQRPSSRWMDEWRRATDVSGIELDTSVERPTTHASAGASSNSSPARGPALQVSRALPSGAADGCRARGVRRGTLCVLERDTPGRETGRLEPVGGRPPPPGGDDRRRGVE